VDAVYAGAAPYGGSTSNKITFATTTPYAPAVSGTAKYKTSKSGTKVSIAVKVVGNAKGGPPAGSVSADDGFTCAAPTVKTNTLSTTCTNTFTASSVDAPMARHANFSRRQQSCQQSVKGLRPTFVPRRPLRKPWSRELPGHGSRGWDCLDPRQTKQFPSSRLQLPTSAPRTTTLNRLPPRIAGEAVPFERDEWYLSIGAWELNDFEL
jgi:hypothetical protein